MRSLAISGYVFSIFIAASLAACGGASHSITQAALPASRVPTRPPTGGAEFLYVADGNSFWPATGAIGAFTLENGFLEQLQDSPYRAYTPAGLAADPVANYLYASSKAKGIYGYYVDPYTGALSLIAGSPFGGPEGQLQLHLTARSFTPLFPLAPPGPASQPTRLILLLALYRRHLKRPLVAVPKA